MDFLAPLDATFWLNAAVIFVLLVMSAFFSGSETALTGSSRAKLRAQAELMPQFGDYVTSAAPRVIPAFHIARTA